MSASLATCQPPGARFKGLFDSRGGDQAAGAPLEADAGGRVVVSLAPLQCVIWKAQAPLLTSASHPSVQFASPAAGSTLAFAERTTYGQIITERQEFRADVAGGDGFAEVTFVMKRASRPNQYELMGTADSAPYQVFWRPPADLAPGDELTFLATVDDLRGHKVETEIDHMRVAPTTLSFGIRGATVPVFNFEPEPVVEAAKGRDLSLAVSASGTGPLEFEWLHDGMEIAGASAPTLALNRITAGASGHYRALVHNREGTAVSRDIVVRVGP